MMLRAAALVIAGTVWLAVPSAPAEAQRSELVLAVYGEDPCPTSNGQEIVVCYRLPEDERYRIPEALRESRDLAASDSWRNRAQALEYVGRTGTMSCSPVGPGGASGCMNELFNAARAERGGGSLLEF